MTRYADRTRCPDCRVLLPVNPDSCPGCALPLGHPMTHELLRILEDADSLVLRLRALIPAEPAGLLASPLPTYPRPSPRIPPVRRGLRAASVPTILLGLGALCLFVAAVTFLAVAWSWMGVGGRTAVLLGLTLTSAGAGVWLAHRGLRTAAESLLSVSLGLITLDVLGADRAGWLGDRSPDETLVLVGAGVAIVAATLLRVPSRLAVPQVGTFVGLGLASAGAVSAVESDLWIVVGAVVTFASVAAAGRCIGATALTWLAASGAAVWWAWLLLSGVADAADHASLRGLWVEGHGAGLIAATVLVMVPVAFARSVARPCSAAAATLVSITVALPALDEHHTAIAVTALITILLWTAVLARVPASWSIVPGAPLAVAALPALMLCAGMVAEATARLTDVGAPLTLGAGVRLAAADPTVHPALLLPLVTALLLAARVTAGRGAFVPLLLVSGLVLPVAAVATLASYAVPLASVVGLVAGVSVGLAVAASRSQVQGIVVAAGSAVAATAAVVLALPSAGLTAAGTAVAAGVALTLLAARAAQVRSLGELMLPAALGGFLWCAGDLAGIDLAWRALPVLLVAGVVSIVRPTVPVEASAAAVGTLASLGSVTAAPDPLTSLALHLTVAGALVTVSGLVHPDRRWLGWPGGLLLAAATWVRLADLGVQAPEAYTLPTAIVLGVVGLRRLHLDPESSTRSTLLPALSLATVPSLLWVLAGDPVTLRAVLLGAGCLALVLAGTRMHWSSPLVVGAGVGGLLVLRKLAPYAAATPQWVLIGVAGTLLTVVGVTWERRLVEVREATSYLGRLR